MRFFENGPDIPDDLLNARDEGRVVFFCGAGVSRARAGLLDFFGLAENVIRTLGVPTDSSVCKILDESRDIHKRTGVDGLISADRIFGLLERDFLVRDIESAVAEALKPKKDVDLSAHLILLDLATTQENKVQLVTTNFDRLFDECGRELKIWQPPRLPEPTRHDEMDGIIYLHGCANKSYSGSEGDGFILSSSEFGRAYLSEGWATNFFREIIKRYVVVFVGYSADDPPVHYLLEGLNNKESQLSGVYAFQSGETSAAAAKWAHKGVKAIAYSEDEAHCALWNTLEAWSVRAKDPDAWYQSVINHSKSGPESHIPHERGQVAHIVSALEGMRKFTEAEPQPPAEWLCVFDPYRRYAKPGNLGGFGSQGPYFDPFNSYGLDSDISPEKIDPNDHNTKREVPDGVWDAFATNRLDRKNLHEQNLPAIRGHWATNSPKLPPRLNQIGMWISKVSNQPAAIWWAASQNGLHPDIRQWIKWELDHSHKDIPPAISQAWMYLFDVWDETIDDNRRDFHALRSEINKKGWNHAFVRKYAAINRPYLKVGSNYWKGPKPPEQEKEIRIGDMIRLDVAYPDFHSNIKIPDDWLFFLVREIRKNLEYALQLENEIGVYGLNRIVPIIPDDKLNDDKYERTHGLSGWVIAFTTYFERLIKLNTSKAFNELMTWPTEDETIFSRLRIWACGKAEFISPQTFDQIFSSLSDDAFWDEYHQRDLLLVLEKRWNELQDKTQNVLEKRLLKGRAKWDNEDNDEYEKRKTWEILNRITWLKKKGCAFSSNIEEEINKLLSKVPNWKPEYAGKADGSMESRGGTVRIDSEYSSLLHEPLSSLLTKAFELSGRTDDFLVEKAPFAGLSKEYPIRSFSALSYAAKHCEFPEWAWRTFLNSESRKSDKPKLSALIAERISHFPDESVAVFLRPTSDWLFNVSKQLAIHYPHSFDKILVKLIDIFKLQPIASNTAIIRGNKVPDWTMEAINAPVGKIAQALFHDTRKDNLQTGSGFPSEWLAYVDDLLSLPKDLRQYAIVIFSHNLNWFYAIDPEWTESNLLSCMEGSNDDDRGAFWSGFLWSATIPNQTLYKRLRPSLLDLTKSQRISKLGHIEMLASLILAGWGSMDERTQDRLISNNELREVLLDCNEDFRSRILWQIGKWTEIKENEDTNKWASMLPAFLRDVWPRQKSVKSSTISAHLCDLAFSNAKLFPELAEIILPLLTTVHDSYLMLPNLSKSKNNIVDLYPHQTLALLHAVLPDNVAAWPYEVDETINRISEADCFLNTDQRLLEIKRKWNAR